MLLAQTSTYSQGFCGSLLYSYASPRIVAEYALSSLRSKRNDELGVLLSGPFAFQINSLIAPAPSSLVYATRSETGNDGAFGIVCRWLSNVTVNSGAAGGP